MEATALDRALAENERIKSERRGRFIGRLAAESDIKKQESIFLELILIELMEDCFLNGSPTCADRPVGCIDVSSLRS